MTFAAHLDSAICNTRWALGHVAQSRRSGSWIHGLRPLASPGSIPVTRSNGPMKQTADTSVSQRAIYVDLELGLVHEVLVDQRHLDDVLAYPAAHHNEISTGAADYALLYVRSRDGAVRDDRPTRHAEVLERCHLSVPPDRNLERAFVGGHGRRAQLPGGSSGDLLFEPRDDLAELKWLHGPANLLTHTGCPDHQRV
jgi:hypothetical protein